MVSSPPPPPPPSSSGDKDPNPTRRILGLGFWIQGFRCLPWMAINFFLKDGLHVDPSTLQLLQNSANLPMVGKPLYGVISDAVYISGQHRIPYIAIGGIKEVHRGIVSLLLQIVLTTFLQSVSWLAIAILSPSGISIVTLSLCLLLSNLGASIAEVANDAIVAEIGKQPAVPPKKSHSYSSGELQSFVWIASSAGGVLGNLLGGLAITIYGPQAMFLLFSLTVALQLFIIITVRESSLNLPKSSSRVGLRKQLSELSVALQKPEIACSITWLAASNAIVPALTGTMFFYQTQYLNINSSVLGISKGFWPGSNASMECHLQSFFKGVYRSMGVPDLLYVIVFSGLLEVLFFFKLLPFNILMAQLCPSGCEGSLMAFVASATALSFIVSGFLGVALSSFVGVTGSDFSGLPRALLIQAVCTVLPVYWSSCIPDDKTSSRNRKNE
ncbi:hypothetical protein OIU77_007032 [Salix suchowensis]|uniref:Folate-biopterin transporter 7 n=1 Tax=Salix suchowensis TaxID=1278906 RepID=A0ABQ9ANP4_9ROSI|nr:hypothetical protein OIU77_007032 [Salix suchowensis]